MSRLKVQFSIEPALMNRVDEYCKENYLNRSSFFAICSTQFLNQNDVVTCIRDLSLAVRKIADEGNIDEESQKKLDEFERISKLLLGK